uniref:EF-hand domain-containing protein n=1 Tax=Pyrodinium bahamense TaxID=73915 RepID=A0A7S0FAJ3_9DINO|mmetsp:Transcript_15457/g.42630  ORF Transcript_15457/g.42630 Transcript_15457/m.42630 type:complete len:510 (+) Transcript_15457:102-1631(+)
MARNPDRQSAGRASVSVSNGDHIRLGPRPSWALGLNRQPRPSLPLVRWGSQQQATSEEVPFNEGPNFPYIIGTVIAANIVLLAAETDYRDLQVWWFCDVSFFLVFAAELAFRASHFGSMTLIDGSERLWTAIDCVTVAAGFLEVVLPMAWPLLAGTDQDTVNDSLLFQVVRLVRLLRLLRFLRIAKRVAALGEALMSMMDACSVIFGVLFLFILLCAVLCTQLLGHAIDSGGSGNSDTDNLLQKMKENFNDVPTSMFTLFQITTLDNWMDVAGPAIAQGWQWQIFFVVFISFGSWTMISILTAVASDRMVAAASDWEEIEAREREALRESFLSFLRDAFIEADVDGNGVMDREEFDSLIKKDSVKNYMSQQGVGVSVDDLEKAWETLDASAGRTGELTIDEFVTGFLTLSKGISTHDIANVDYSLRKTSSAAACRIQRLIELVRGIKARNEEVISALEKQSAMQQEQWTCMELWRGWVLEQNGKWAPNDDGGSPRQTPEATVAPTRPRR